MQNKHEIMTKSPVEKLILKLSVPTIISMLITTFYNMADTYFVSRLNNTSTTGAVGVVFALMSVIQAFGFFYGHGSGTFISRKLGAGEKNEAERMASLGFFYALITGTLIMIFGFIFIKPLAYLLGATDTIYPYAKDYLTYILFSAPFMCASLVLNNQLRFQGNASFAMLGIVAGAILNCVLDPILIFAFDMGIKGAGIATAAGQFASFVLLFVGLNKSDSAKISISNFKPDIKQTVAVINGGFPSLCRQGIASFGAICLNSMAGAYGDFAITGMSICSRVTMFFNSVMIGFGQGFQPVCGYNYGAKLYDRVTKAFWFCVKTSLVFLIVISLLGVVFSKQIIDLFTHDNLVLDFGSRTFRLMCMAFPLNSWIVMSNMTMQTMGKAVRASILAASRQGIVFIPVLLVMVNLFSLEGLMYTQAITDVITFLISIPLQISVLKELKKTA